MSSQKRFMNKPDYWIDMLEQSYNNWGRLVKHINKDLKDLQSIENTILMIEMKLKDMGIEGFAKTTTD